MSVTTVGLRSYHSFHFKCDEPNTICKSKAIVIQPFTQHVQLRKRDTISKHQEYTTEIVWPQICIIVRLLQGIQTTPRSCVCHLRKHYCPLQFRLLVALHHCIFYMLRNRLLFRLIVTLYTLEYCAEMQVVSYNEGPQSALQTN